ncbi:MAG TPA: DUF6428 family protein [Verrucomicrobiae bacterium]|jgi:arsenate reductase
MNVSQLKTELNKRPEAILRFILPNGNTIPAHAHVIEVARIDKRFIDCGGTLRNDSQCRLQTWFSDDVDHRLTAGKLSRILEMAVPVLGSNDLEVDIEHEVGFITQFPLESVEVLTGEIVLHLAERRTACLAPEKCKPVPAKLSDFNPLKLNFKEKQSGKTCCTPTENYAMKKKVLFICIHNSARSQMAGAFLKQVCGHEFEVESAGLEPGKLNPVVVEAMQEIGIDISGNSTKAVWDFAKSGMVFAYVITVCDETSAERCPIFPGVTTRLHWGFPDPSGFSGSHDEKLAKVREVRDTIKCKIEAWCQEICSPFAA